MVWRGKFGQGEARWVTAVMVRHGVLRHGWAWQGGYGEAWSGGVCWVGVRRGMARRLRCGVAECGLVWHG